MAEVPSSQAVPEEPIMEIDEEAEVPFDAGEKIEILKGYEPDFSAATYCLHNEDHTLGNALRYMLMKNPSVEFCGYSNPHPSEPKIHLRIQMYDRKSSLTALHEALDNLEQLFDTIGESYQTDLEAEKFERFEEPGLTEEQRREVIAEGQEIKRRQREERRATDAARAASGTNA